MARHKYNKTIRVKVAKEALLPENAGQEHVIAQKYGIKPWTVRKWAEMYQEFGEDAFRTGHVNGPGMTEREKQLVKERAELREEIEILKKAAAFLEDLQRK